MATLSDAIYKRKNPGAASSADVQSIEQAVQEGIKEIKKVVEDTKNDLVFGTLMEPTKEAARGVAQEETGKFRTETTGQIETTLRTLEAKKEQILADAQEQLDAMFAEISPRIDAMMEESHASMEGFKSETSTFNQGELTTLRKNFDTFITESRAKVNALKAEKGRDGASGPKGEKGEDGSPDTAQQVVTKVNKAKGVKMSAIEGLEQKLETLAANIRQAKQQKKGGGGGGMGKAQSETKNLTALTTTVTTAYPIANRGGALLAFYQGAYIVPGTSYTVGGDNRTLTLLFTPLDGTFLDLHYVRG